MVAPRFALIVATACTYRVGCDGSGPPGPSTCAKYAVDAGRDAGDGGARDSGTQDAGFPPTSSLTDAFDGGPLGPLWIQSLAPGTSFVLDGGYLALVPAANATGINEVYVYSAGLFDFTGSSVSVKVAQMVTTTSTAYAWMGVSAPTSVANDRIEVYQSDGILTFRYWLDGGVYDNAPVAYDPMKHLYWRMRETSGVSFWETSADGATFTVQFQLPTPIAANEVRIDLGAGTYEPIALPGEVGFGNLGILP
jgi:hypothetical protein